MLPGPASLVLSVCLAGLVGFAVAHGGICAVRAINDLLDGRGGALFLAFLKCSAWVAAITLPLNWIMVPGGHFAPGYPLAWPVAAGGFLFGVGAALNGGCAFSTVSHLGAGDFGQVFALLGLGLGFALHGLWIGPLVPPAALLPPDALARPEAWSLALLAAAWLWAAREASRLRRPAPDTGADRMMAVVALASGALYVLHGPWVYTAGLAQGAAWAARVGPAPSALLPLLFAGTLAGAVLAAWKRGRLRPRRPEPRPAMLGLVGGVLMGVGAALVPGGNDALILHALPALLPHAAMAYAALVAGAACTLALLRIRRGFGQGGCFPRTAWNMMRI
jgi:uncharacterized membrane protein YedE/YeeE